MNTENNFVNPADIRCIVFDFGFTLSSDLYFKVAPPECPNWQALIQQHIFGNADLVDKWMGGAMTLRDIAMEFAPVVGMAVPRIVNFMELGCKDLDFNEAVLDFAVEQRERGRKTALVTGNMDVFTKIVVPFHNLSDKFDVIVNSFDYRETDKLVLWPQAFELLGNEVGYGQSLLIEDSEKNVTKFRESAGYAYQYEGDARFLEWLGSVKWR